MTLFNWLLLLLLSVSASLCIFLCLSLCLRVSLSSLNLCVSLCVFFPPSRALIHSPTLLCINSGGCLPL